MLLIPSSRGTDRKTGDSMPPKTKLYKRLATALAISLFFPVALGFMMRAVFTSGEPGQAIDVARVMLWLPVFGTAAMAALSSWVLRPALMEVQKVRRVVGPVLANLPKSELQAKTRPVIGMTWSWIFGLVAALGVVLALQADTTAAPLWAPLALITIISQVDPRQTLSERTRWLLLCTVMLYIFGGVGRHWLDQTQGAVLFGGALISLLSWHVWRTRRLENEMRSLLAQAQYEEAISKAKRSESPVAPALRAYAQFRKGDDGAARAGLEQALTLATSSEKAAFALAKLGEVLLASGSPNEAQAPLRAALELRPEEARAHRVLAQINLESKTNPQDALRHAKKAVEFGSSSGPSLAVLAWALAEAGQMEEAEKTLPQARATLQGQSDIAETHYFLGRACQALGKSDESRASFAAVQTAELRGHYRQRAETALAELGA